MLTSVLIIVFAALLLGYWFRRTCLLLLSVQHDARVLREVVEANQLSVFSVQEALQSEGEAPLDTLARSLERDFRVMQFLLKQAEDLRGSELERTLLALDFRLMQLCYRCTRRGSRVASRHALGEMTTVVTHFAAVMGHRAAG
jgi:hypothetical protein